jgi:OHCU decarboxylase
MNSTLTNWNTAPEQTALEAMLTCCGATRWAAAMTAARPIPTPESLYETADRIWSQMQEPDWLEAFACHPRIGDRKPVAHVSTQSASWSKQEQSSTQTAADQTLLRLALLNAQYKEQFGFTYIICATGKSVEEMLAILERRSANDRITELKEAAEQQRQIILIRLSKWLQKET